MFVFHHQDNAIFQAIAYQYWHVNLLFSVIFFDKNVRIN